MCDYGAMDSGVERRFKIRLGDCVVMRERIVLQPRGLVNIIAAHLFGQYTDPTRPLRTLLTLIGITTCGLVIIIVALGNLVLSGMGNTILGLSNLVVAGIGAVITLFGAALAWDTLPGLFIGRESNILTIDRQSVESIKPFAPNPPSVTSGYFYVQFHAAGAAHRRTIPLAKGEDFQRALTIFQEAGWLDKA
jgi:hypothetical protein